MRTLQGRVAVVTGASQGLGRAISLELARDGARLALIGRSEAKLAEVAKEASELGAHAGVFRTDITQETEIHALKDRLELECGRVDILVNNAGIMLRKALLDCSPAEWRHVIDTNLTSAFLMCRSLVPLMRGRGYGRIINITSTLSHVSLPQRTAYSASKAGLLGFTRALALELAPERITVVAISPGPFATELNTSLMTDSSLNAQILSKVPLGAWGDPRHVGKLARFLCSEDAAYITGTAVLIDGGWTTQ